MKILEFTKVLEQIAPPAYQESYDNSGLLTGSIDDEVKGVLICLDSTEDVIQEAIDNNCNLIIAHHPIVFKGLKRLNGSNYVERVIIKAIKNDIAIYAIHTNLDNVLHQGVNAKIAEKLGLTNLKVLDAKRGVLKKLYTFAPAEHAEKVKNALFNAGAGNISNYSECSFNVEGTGTFKGAEGTNPFVGEVGLRHQEAEIKIEVIFPAHLENNILKELFAAHPYEEVAYDIVGLDNQFDLVGSGLVGELKEPIDTAMFLRELKSKMKTDCIRYTAICKDKISRVAVCGGAGSFLLKNAIRAKADIFVSADFKYHEFFDAENRIIIADIGHYESEQFTIEIIYDILLNKFPIFAILKSKVKTNPVSYL
jgi:dinuclear metal center YbgI/SA1388 family protein